jgi:transcriptional regulator with XRE-family HTH domain
MERVAKPVLRVEAYGLAQAREALGITQADLARRTGKRVNYFYMLEALKRWPSQALQNAILEHLPGYRWDELFRLVLVLPVDLPTNSLNVRCADRSWELELGAVKTDQ